MAAAAYIYLDPPPREVFCAFQAMLPPAPWGVPRRPGDAAPPPPPSPPAGRVQTSLMAGPAAAWSSPPYSVAGWKARGGTIPGSAPLRHWGRPLWPAGPAPAATGEVAEEEEGTTEAAAPAASSPVVPPSPPPQAGPVLAVPADAGRTAPPPLAEAGAVLLEAAVLLALAPPLGKLGAVLEGIRAAGQD